MNVYIEYKYKWTFPLFLQKKKKKGVFIEWKGVSSVEEKIVNKINNRKLQRNIYPVWNRWLRNSGGRGTTVDQQP